MTNKKLVWIVGIVAVVLLAVFAVKEASATYIPEVPVEETECVEVSAPDPIEFKKGFVQYKWFETSEGTWKLYFDIDPRGGHEYWKYADKKIVEKDCEEPEVTPTPQAPVEEPDHNKPGVAPMCPETNTVAGVANAHVWRNGSSATVNFFITEGNSAIIYYSEVGQPHWQHSVAGLQANSDKFVSFTINDLKPELGYDFGIQQVNGCSGGMTTAVVVDGPESQLFTVTYWE